MTDWDDGWQIQALKDAGISVTDFAVQVLTLWAAATPTVRWTNNPLGMPAAGFSSQRMGNTAYAAFPTMPAFGAAFKIEVHSKSGKPLFTALAAQDKLSVVWRTVHALGWPANSTETDYPSTILDAVTDASTAAMKASKPGARKTVGLADTRSNVHAVIQTHGQLFYQSAANINSAGRALNTALGRVNRRGG